MSDNDKDNRKSFLLAQMAVGFFLGAGGAGAAVTMIGQEGYQTYGLITLLVCALFAVGLILVYYKDDKDRERREFEERRLSIDRTYEEKKRQIELEQEERTRRENLQQLADFYDECFKNTGINLALRLQSHGADLKQSVIKMLLVDLETQEENILKRRRVGQELSGIFHSSIKGIRDKWQDLAIEDLPIAEGAPDEDAKPLTVDEPKAPAEET
jgi:hypothetical protein